MESLIVLYGTKVTRHNSFNSQAGLRNNRIGKYLHLEPESAKFTCSGNHPFIQIKNNGDVLPSNEEFLIIHIQNQEYKGPVTFGSAICLMTRDGHYVLANSNGEMRLEKPKFDQDQLLFLKTAKWIILDSNNIASRRQVCYYDDIVFKSPHGLYLSIDSNQKVSANSQSVTPDSSWKFFRSNIPYMPEWTLLRPFVSENYLIPQLDQISSEKMMISSSNLRQLGEDKKPLGELTTLYQELYLIEDILYVMMSIEGNYIKRVPDPANKNILFYVIEPTIEHSGCDISLKQLVNRILPICSHHDKLKNFVNLHSSFDSGLVSQALCAAIKVLMREYVLLINQLDNEFNKGELNLQKLWFYIQPSMKVLENLMGVVKECEKLTGGALLSAIFKLMKSATDEQTLQVYQFLLDKSFLPYCDMLSKWIYHGVIDDTYEEFMIKERKELSKENINKDYKDSYWEKRFTLRENQFPVFLEKLKEPILQTGKYLNVIRECDRNVNCPFADELSANYDAYMKSLDFTEPALKAYEWANYHLNNLVLGEEQLMARLKSIKHYFFLDLGDFFVHFLDSAEEELSKGVKSVSKEKVESLLEMSLRTSSANADPFKDDVMCELLSYTLPEQLFAIQNIISSESGGLNMNQSKNNVFTPLQNIKGIESFTLDYKVRWPLNIILSRKSLTRYQLIFRHLFYCKYVERQLCDTWLIHQSTKQLDLQRSITHSYLLTQRMIHFSKNLVYYIVYEVLEQKWIKFEQAMKNVTNFDDILQLHNNFLDECMKETLLLDHSLLKILSKINNTCLIFAKAIQNFTQNMQVNEHEPIVPEENMSKMNNLEKRKNKINQESMATKKIIKEQSYLGTIQKFAKTFDQHLRDFMSQANQQSLKFDNHLSNLLSRLDYDGFYSSYVWGNQNQHNMSGMSMMSNAKN